MMILMLLFKKERRILISKSSLSYQEFVWFKNNIQHEFRPNLVTIQLQIALEISLFFMNFLIVFL